MENCIRKFHIISFFCSPFPEKYIILTRRFAPLPPLFLPKPEPVVTGPQVTPDSGSGINRYNTAQPPFREEVNKLKQKI